MESVSIYDIFCALQFNLLKRCDLGRARHVLKWFRVLRHTAVVTLGSITPVVVHFRC